MSDTYEDFNPKVKPGEQFKAFNLGKGTGSGRWHYTTHIDKPTIEHNSPAVGAVATEVRCYGQKWEIEWSLPKGDVE